MSALLKSSLRFLSLQRIKHKTKIKSYPYKFRLEKDDCVTYVWLDIYDNLGTGEIISSNIVMTYNNPFCTPRPPLPPPTGHDVRGEFPGGNPIFYFRSEAAAFMAGTAGSSYTEVLTTSIIGYEFREYPGNNLDGGLYNLGIWHTADGRDLGNYFYIENHLNGYYKENERPTIPLIKEEYIENGINYGIIPVGAFVSDVYGYFNRNYPIDEYGNWIDIRNGRRVFRNKTSGHIERYYTPDDPIFPKFEVIAKSPQVGLRVTANFAYGGSINLAQDMIWTSTHDNGGPWKINAGNSWTVTKSWDVYMRPEFFGVTGTIIDGVRLIPFSNYMYALSLGGSELPENPETGSINDSEESKITPLDSGGFVARYAGIAVSFVDPDSGDTLKPFTDWKFGSMLSYQSIPPYNAPENAPKWWGTDQPGEIRKYWGWVVYNGYTEIPPMKQDCCADIKKLLKIIIKNQEDKIIPNQEEKIIPVLGDFPAEVPDLFTKQNPAIVKKDNLLDLILWQTKQLDALLGAYPIKIKLKDSDLTKEGDQSKEVKLPNIAETLAEILGVLLAMQTESSANLDISFKTLCEAAQAKKAATISSEAALANAEFLGYELKQKKRKMKLLFDPSKERIEEALKTSEVEYVGYENTDKSDLNDYLRKLLEGAAIIKAVHFINVKDPGDLYRRMGVNVKNLEDKFEEDQKEDFDTFTENAERGFTNISGSSIPPETPYLRPFEERPRIKEIGQNETQGDN